MPVGCPSESQLLALALASDSAANAPGAKHIAGCRDCQQLFDQLQQTLALVRSNASAIPPSDTACLTETTIAALAEGSLSGTDRDAAIMHLARCGACRGTFAALVMLLNDPAIAAEVTRVDPVYRKPRQRWPIVMVGGLAAAAAVALLFTRPSKEPSDLSEHRGPTITAAGVPSNMTPTGDVTARPTFRWSRISGADTYRLTLFTATGSVRFAAEVHDTFVALPDSVQIDRGQSYLWKVEARTDRDRWSSSELIEFRVTAPGTTSDVTQPDSLRFRARTMSDSALAHEVGAHPLDLREALSGTLAGVVHRDTSADLATAQRLAKAYATTWHDDYFSKLVDRFASWTIDRRAAHVWIDSVRHVGVTTFSSSGAPAAIAIWRTAYAKAASLADTAAMGSLLGNIGAAWPAGAPLDSAAWYIERSRRFAAAAGDLRTEANALAMQATASESQNDMARTRQLYDRAIALHERIGDSRGLASDYNNLAGLAQNAGDLAEARRQLEAALALNVRDSRPEKAATNLVNLATLSSLTGDFARADSLYRSALTTWRARSQWSDVADVTRDLGKLDLRRGKYAEAQVELTEALGHYERTGAAAEALTVRQEIASTRAAQGDLQGALDALRETQRRADSLQMSPGVRGRITLARADLAAQLNARPEAERLYEAAAQLARKGGERVVEAGAQQGLGAMLIDQGNGTRAQELLDASLRTNIAAGSQRAAALTRLTLGELLLERGDTLGAQKQMARGATDLEKLGDPVATAAALGEQATLAMRTNRPAAAESFYRAALTKVADRQAPEVTWRLHAGLGNVRRDRGAVDEAAREMRLAISDIERAGTSLALSERRSGFLSDKWDVYAELALIERSRGQAAAAFDVSERLRAGEMREMLARGQVAAPVNVGGALAAREQDLRRQIAELTRGLEGAGAGRQQVRGPDISGVGPVTRETLLQAQQSYADLLLEIKERAPRHAALVATPAATWRDVSRLLSADEIFVEYLVTESSSLAFVTTRDTMVMVKLIAGRKELSRLVDFARGTLTPRGTPRLDSLWHAPLRQLYSDLVGPIEQTGLLANKTRLIVVPHAELHYLPFGALISGNGTGQFLVQRFDISVTPSASVWLALSHRNAPHATAGIVAFAPQPDALPASRQEVAAIMAATGGDTRVLTGAAATKAAFLREAPSRRVIHLASYGVLNKQNPLFSFVELAGDATGNGRLEVHEVFGLQLNADLVVLSACQTALASGAVGDVPAGDDWIGLTRAFLSAGAQRVMATLWPVQDRATATLMEQFYQRYRVGADPAHALAQAQRVVLASPATASPYYWAGFEVVGGR